MINLLMKQVQESYANGETCLMIQCIHPQGTVAFSFNGGLAFAKKFEPTEEMKIDGDKDVVVVMTRLLSDLDYIHSMDILENEDHINEFIGRYPVPSVFDYMTNEEIANQF